METSKSITNQETIKEWVALYGDDLLRWALNKTSNKEISEDLVQETFIGAFKSLDKFEGKSQPKTWLTSILNNKVIDYHRKQFRENTVNQSKLGVESSDVLDYFFNKDGSWNNMNNPSNWHDIQGHFLDDEDFNRILLYCMNELPEKWYSAVTLKYLEEKNSKDICKELEITSSNFWQILHRSKLQLKGCLEKKWFNS